MSYIQIRINEYEKKEVKKIFKDLGLDMSTAIKLFLNKVRNTKGLPFLLTTENGLSSEQEDKILKASQEANNGKNISKAFNKKEAIDYLKNL